MEDNAVFTLTLDIPGTLCRMVAPDTSHLAEEGGAGCGMLCELFSLMGPDTGQGVTIIMTPAENSDQNIALPPGTT